MTEDTRNRLLEAAGRVFADRGFEAATVREICDAAEANIAAVNYYFGDKQKLYIEAVKEAQCARCEVADLPQWPMGTPTPDKLRDFIRVMLQRMLYEERPAWHLELMLRELARPTEACETVVEAYIRPMAESLKQILEDVLPAEMNERDRFLVGASVVAQCLFFYVQRPIIALLMGRAQYETLSIDLLSEHIARFSLAALGFAPPLVPEAVARK